jgi:hypothetical protein
MKVYSLYHNETYVASFPNKEDAVFYGKQFYEDGWSCNIIEEYLSKTPYQMYTLPYTTPNTIPCVSPNSTKIVHNSHPNDPKPHFDTYSGVKAEPYKNVSAYWEQK